MKISLFEHCPDMNHWCKKHKPKDNYCHQPHPTKPHTNCMRQPGHDGNCSAYSHFATLNIETWQPVPF